MNEYNGHCASSQSFHDDSSDMYPDFYCRHNAQSNVQHHQPCPPPVYEQQSMGYNLQQSDGWSATGFEVYGPADHRQHHFSSGSLSSGATSLRSSDNSLFSSFTDRGSVASSVSDWSQSSSTFSRTQHISQTEYWLTQNSDQQSQSSQRTMAPSPQVPKRRLAPRSSSTDRDYFKTCVSATRQPRPCTKEHKFFCTICKRSFVTKADWKRHEETYQERRDMFKCDLCEATYFLEKDFYTHHIQSHRCAACNDNRKGSRKRHVEAAKSHRNRRTGWGCGFCIHFSSSWSERCNHVAEHIENEKKTLKDWRHSFVIYSLLQRPAVFHEWSKLLENKGQHITISGWNQHSTGRIEGYPEINSTIQLQDALEYFLQGHDAAALARMAYDKAVKQAPSTRDTVPPPVPPKDYQHMQIPNLALETDAWTCLMDTIPEDMILPSGVYNMNDFSLD